MSLSLAWITPLPHFQIVPRKMVRRTLIVMIVMQQLKWFLTGICKCTGSTSWFVTLERHTLTLLSYYVCFISRGIKHVRFYVITFLWGESSAIPLSPLRDESTLPCKHAVRGHLEPVSLRDSHFPLPVHSVVNLEHHARIGSSFLSAPGLSVSRQRTLRAIFPSACP